VDRDGKVEPLGPDWAHGFGWANLSPDGSSVAFGRGGDVWVRGFDGALPVQLTFEGDENFHPSWTPEGDSVLLDTRDGLYTRSADGSGQAVLTHVDEREIVSTVWSPDRTWLIYRTNVNLTGSGDILAIRPGQDSDPIEIVASPAMELGPALSRDGRWLAYSSDESGRNEVYVVPFPSSGDAKWQVSTSGGVSPRWSHDARELYYGHDGGLMVVDVQFAPSFTFGEPRALLPAGEFNTGGFLDASYDVAPDGRFLVMRYLSGVEESRLVFVQNFFEDLKERAGN
jgi:serine/threonine-protein kinase